MAADKNILIIENDRDFANMIGGLMAKFGFESRITVDPEEGVQYAKDARPALIVLCVELGQTSGYMVCKRIKKEDDIAGIPLILTSAEATEKDFEQHRKLKVRADDYLLKPFTDEDFLTKVQNLLGFELSSDEYKNLEAQVHDFLEEKVLLEDKIRNQADLIHELEQKVSLLEADLATGIPAVEAAPLSGESDPEEAERFRKLETELKETQDLLDEEAQLSQQREAARLALEREVEKLRSEVETARNAASGGISPTELVERDEKIRKLQSDLDDKKERLETANLQLSSLKEALEDMEDLRRHKKEAEEKLHGEVDRVRREYEGKIAERDKKDDERKALREQLSSRVTELTEERKDLKEKILRAEMRVHEVEKERREREERFQALEGEVQAQKAQFEEQVGELRDQVVQLESRSADLTREIGELKTEREALQKQAEEARREMASEKDKRKKMKDILTLAFDVN